jgi:hypothetical protein
MSDQIMMRLLFVVLAIGFVAPLFRRARAVVLGAAAGIAVIVMSYFYVVSIADRPLARSVAGCEAVVLVLLLLALRRKGFFWLAWASHAVLAIVCAGVVIWVRFFFHPSF